jgi:hypothetical protein
LKGQNNVKIMSFKDAGGGTIEPTVGSRIRNFKHKVVAPASKTQAIDQMNRKD